MGLEKIGFSNIRWEKKGSLYGGHYQGIFEETVLKSIVDGMSPSYWGVETREEGRITFVSPDYYDGPFYAHLCAERSYSGFGIFSRFPLILEVIRSFPDQITS